MRAVAVLALAYLVGSIPVANLVARRTLGVDLRGRGVGKVSASALYRVGGAGPLLLAAALDITKGAVGPLAAGGRGRMLLAAFAGGLSVAGHDWSPFLHGRGGRGLAPALGALVVLAWPGTLLLLAGLGLGKMLRHSALGGFVAEATLVPFLALAVGGDAALAGVCVAVPLLAKRALAEGAPEVGGWRPYVGRLLFDPGDEPPGPR